MERQQRTLTLLLIVALLIGAYNSIQLRNLRSAVDDAANRTSSQISSVQSSIQSSIWSINSSIAQMREEERWVYPASYAARQDLSSADGVVLELSWSFRELQKGADVVLLYRPLIRNAPTQWIRAETVLQEGAAYSALVSLSPDLEYEYQIAVEGDYLRSSAAVRIPASLYQPQPLRVSSWGGGVSRDGKWIGDFQFEVEQPYVSLFDFLNAEDVFVNVSREDGTSSRHEATHVKRDGYAAWFFVFPAAGLKQLEIGVTYGDGKTYYTEVDVSGTNMWRHSHELQLNRGDSPPTIVIP